MEAITRKIDPGTEAVSDQRSGGGEPPGLRSARPGLQPVQDWVSFLASLPDFGEDADRLLEAVMENRAQRRLETEERGC